MEELVDGDSREPVPGIRFLQRMRPLLARLHEDGTQRDRAGKA